MMGTAGVGMDPSARINDGSTHGLILDGESGRLIGKIPIPPSSSSLPLPLSHSLTLRLSFSSYLSLTHVLTHSTYPLILITLS